MTVDPAVVAERVGEARERILRAGGVDVSIVAVTKGFDSSAIVAACAAGVRLIGENYAQEAVPKIRAARAAGADFEAHFIGAAQTNKVRSLVGVIDVWETVDRPSLVAELAVRGPGSRCLVQVNSTGEPSKSGCAPGAVDGLVERARSSGLRVEGLMTMGPTDGAVDAARDAFRLTRSLADRLGLRHCSMGMSGDLEIAVGEGATLVRLGTALFGARPRR